MKKLPQHMDDLLLDFIDGNLTAEKREEVQRALQEQPDLAQRLNELKSAHLAMKKLTWEEPSRNFTLQVMNRLDEKQTQRVSVRNGIFLLAGIVVIMTIAVILVSAGVFDQVTTLDLNDVSLAQRYIRQNLPAFSIDAKRTVNVIILLNLVVAFIVLDRAVLKPFFKQRMHTGH